MLNLSTLVLTITMFQFLDIQNGSLHGLLVIQEPNDEREKYYLTSSLVHQIVSQRDEPYSRYWIGIMKCFNLDHFPDNREDYFESQTLPCLWFEDVCGCAGATPNTYSYCHMLDPINNPDCDTGTCPTGNGGGSGNGQENIDLHTLGFWSGEKIDNISGNGSGGSGGGSGGSSNNNSVDNYDTSAPWSDFCGGFNGSLALADNTDTNLDGSVDTTILENPVDLYLMQLDGFINQHGLQSQFTAEQLMEIISEECAVSNVTEVNKCLKCHLIRDLGLSDSQNYELLDGFGIVANCEGDPNCIECSLAISQFESENGFSFSETEACSDEYNDFVDNLISNGGCSVSEIMEEFNQYFDILESTDPATNPSVRLNDELCPSAFNVQIKKGDITKVTAGILNFRFQAKNFAGTDVTISHPNVHFELDRFGINCPKSGAEMMANAVNNAIAEVRIKIKQVMQYSDLEDSDQFYLTVVRKLNEERELCTPHLSGTYSQVTMTNDPSNYTHHCGTLWKHLSTDNFNNCE